MSSTNQLDDIRRLLRDGHAQCESRRPAHDNASAVQDTPAENETTPMTPTRPDHGIPETQRLTNSFNDILRQFHEATQSTTFQMEQAIRQAAESNRQIPTHITDFDRVVLGFQERVDRLDRTPWDERLNKLKKRVEESEIYASALLNETASQAPRGTALDLIQGFEGGSRDATPQATQPGTTAHRCRWDWVQEYVDAASKGLGNALMVGGALFLLQILCRVVAKVASM